MDVGILGQGEIPMAETCECLYIDGVGWPPEPVANAPTELNRFGSIFAEPKRGSELELLLKLVIHALELKKIKKFETEWDGEFWNVHLAGDENSDFT